jgi:methylase of polypeptide subunit release factors
MHTVSERDRLGAVNEFSGAPIAAVLNPAERALVELGLDLKRRGYRFTTITPASHARVKARLVQAQTSVAGIFGWSSDFAAEDISPLNLQQLVNARAIESVGNLHRSSVRFSTLGEQLFAHSAFPTEDSAAVFFGPDTYRFVRFIRHSLETTKHHSGNELRLLDIGAGSGAAGLHVGAFVAATGGICSVTLSDINPQALRFCRINAAINAVRDVAIVESDLFADIKGDFDLIVANPPYLVDPLARVYRHGGGKLGCELSIRIAEEGVSRLSAGGRLLLYTGSAIVNGTDVFREALFSCLASRRVRLAYEEIDPDVFGEELAHPPYDRVDRIAAVGVAIDRV